MKITPPPATKGIKAWAPLDKNGKIIIDEIELYRTAAKVWANLGKTEEAKVVRVLIIPLKARKK